MQEPVRTCYKNSGFMLTASNGVVSYGILILVIFCLYVSVSKAISNLNVIRMRLSRLWTVIKPRGEPFELEPIIFIDLLLNFAISARLLRW